MPVSFSIFLLHFLHSPFLLHDFKAYWSEIKNSGCGIVAVKNVVAKKKLLSQYNTEWSEGVTFLWCIIVILSFQEVFLTYLWSPDMETVLISLSCFGQMCNETDIVQSSETLNVLPTSQNLNVYSELSNEATKFTAGEFCSG